MIEDLTGRLADALGRDRRPPDGLLHCSGDLCAPMRHVMLRAAGAPSAENHITSEIRLRIGTEIHDYMERAVLRGVPAMTELRLDRWLPSGWSGTADAVVWDADARGFTLLDWKTIKPEGMQYVLKGGAKKEHMHQLSAYWYALERMGIPLTNKFGVYYIPTGQTGPRDSDVAPSMQWCVPLPFAYMRDRMAERREQVKAYRQSLSTAPAGEFLTGALAPQPARVQKLMAAKRDKPGQRDLILAPDWYAAFCPFSSDLCGCPDQGTTKIGHFTVVDKELGTWEYVPRPGYEDLHPEVTP